jgi:hypothetical protein
MNAATWSEKVGVVLRITERAVRTWPLNEWALLRRVLPDGGSSDPDPRDRRRRAGCSLSRNELSRREPGLGWGSRRVGGLTFSHSEFDSGGRHTAIEDADSSR